MSYKDEDFERRDESNEPNDAKKWEENLETGGPFEETGDSDSTNEIFAPVEAGDDFTKDADFTTDSTASTDSTDSDDDEKPGDAPDHASDPSVASTSLEEALDAALSDAWAAEDEDGDADDATQDEPGDAGDRSKRSLRDLDDLGEDSFYDPTKPLLSHELETGSTEDPQSLGVGSAYAPSGGDAADHDATIYAADEELSEEDEDLSPVTKFFRSIRDFFSPRDKRQKGTGARGEGVEASLSSGSPGHGHEGRAGENSTGHTSRQGDLSDQYFSADDFIDLDELQAAEEAELEDGSYGAETADSAEKVIEQLDAPDPVNYPDYSAYAQKTEEESSKGGLLHRLSSAKVSTRVALALTGLVLLFFIAISIWRATIPDPLRPTTMENTAELMRRSLYEQDFDAYRNLFKESHRPEILETEFRELSRIATSDASSSNYSILRMSNGRMLILGMEKDEGSGEFRVLYVLEVPTAMKELFTDRTLGNEEEKQLPIPLGQIPATQDAQDVTTEAPVTEPQPREDEDLPAVTDPLEEPLPYEAVGPKKPASAEDEVKEALAPYESPFGPLKDEEEKLNEAAQKEAAKDSSGESREKDKGTKSR